MKHHLPAGSTADGPFGLVVTPEVAGWERSGLRVLELAGSGHTFGTRGFEMLVRDSEVTVTGTGRFALPAARCENRLTPRYGPAGDVPVELRGAGPASRQVNNFCTPEAFEADRLIACEVLTPGGCWSSYPPHKHDEDRPGECVLEEIYYFEVSGPSGLAYQRVYGTDERPVEILAEGRGGDVVLVPHGWHGPSMAAMWADQPADPRLPLTSTMEKAS
ncbi:5-deoxy-glucuronate isomerase [Spirillospora sp. CA-128828]|uniref:5-deoxy-glucuronate isomerase n=1 Tax=Spirillospora sp. CA-128828 TaxID=3240033 RepID=UPI003D950266